MYNDDYCRTCRGSGKLEVRIYNDRNRFIRYEPEIVCDDCKGARFIRTAARDAAAMTQRQS